MLAVWPGFFIACLRLSVMDGLNSGQCHYEQVLEGPDDMPAHIREALTQTHLTVPVTEGGPMLGTWQGIYYFEHRRAAQMRNVALYFLGE